MDMQGRKISSGSINQNQGEHVIDTRTLESGTYLVNIYNNGKLKSSNKLVVNKK
jgi:hypothetical protein